MKKPEFVKLNNKKIKINTDFRVAIECNRIAEDETITDLERALAIIYTLYGDEGYQECDNYDKLLELALKYLSCGMKSENNDEPDIDYIEDEGYIESSFKHDYKYNPYQMEYLHWYDFFNDLKNLSNSELGDCCVLNRVRNLRNFDTRQIKDSKERERIEKAKEIVSLKKKNKKISKEQEQSMNELNNILGL